MNPGDKTLEQRLGELIIAIGADVKGIKTKNTAQDAVVGDLSSLSTAQKGSIIAAINEVLGIAQNATGVINDAAVAGVTNKTYSVDKILNVVATLKSEIMGGLPATTLDTIKEIADWIANDETVTAGVIASIGKRVAVDAAQTFTETERLQGRANIGAQEAAAIGNTNTDLVALYTTAKA
jgi:hypothetical protein